MSDHIDFECMAVVHTLHGMVVVEQNLLMVESTDSLDHMLLSEYLTLQLSFVVD